MTAATHLEGAAPLDMAVRPIRRETFRAVRGLAREAAARALARRPLEEIAASVMVRAPNAGLPAPPPERGEWRVRVAAPAAILSVRVLSPPDPVGTVFVLHGIRDSGATMGPWAALLNAERYRAVLVDSRGHGRSTGDALTYGVHETRDLIVILDALSARIDLRPAEPIGVMGHSYGAATAIQWAGRDPRVRAVVAVSPFASLRAVVPGYLPFALPQQFARRLVDTAGRLGHFDPDDASPVEAAAKTNAALLIVHGCKDARIPFAHSEQIVARASGPAQLVLVSGAHHDNVAGAPATRLAERSAAWFRSHLSPPV
jgi:alpha-beta hydrolase superfamily lysophospholipase